MRPLLLLTALVVLVVDAACSNTSVAPTSTQEEGTEARYCVSQAAEEYPGSRWESPNRARSGKPPDTHVLTIEVESTSQWTRVEVSGVDSATSEYALLQGGSGIDFSADGLEIFLQESPEENGPALQQPLLLTAVAIVQPRDEDIVFRIVKPRAGTVTYTLSDTSGRSRTEIARFVRGPGDEDNRSTFILELDALPPPLTFAGNDGRYTGPLFDTHLHLVGSKDQDNTAASDDRLHVRPETAESFFATMAHENIVGVIGFLPSLHEHFVPDRSFNDPYQEGTLDVVLGCPNMIVPFLHPNSHIGIPPQADGPRLPGFIADQIQESPIPFKGIGEIHAGYPQTDSYAEMSLVDPTMLELFEYAAVNDLVLMVHPEMDAVDDLRIALDRHPGADFLIHGLVDDFDRTQIAEVLMDLFRDHENLYFSVDANLMLGYDLMNFETRNKEQFLGNLRSESTYYRVLASALAFWKPIIEAHPTRMMWGTDLYYIWHYEPEVIHEIVRFGRDFIGGLTPEVQEMFGYRNALRMLDLPGATTAIPLGFPRLHWPLETGSVYGETVTTAHR